jgi:hypothetical protein
MSGLMFRSRRKPDADSEELGSLYPVDPTRAGPAVKLRRLRLLASRALRVGGLRALGRDRMQGPVQEHLTPNRARERLSRLPDSQQLAELCDETSHRASLRPARGVSIGAFGLRTGRRTKVPHFAVYLSTVPARCSCRARSPVAWVAAARGGSRRPKRQRERPPSLFMSRSPLPSSFGPSPRGAASPRGH